MPYLFSTSTYACYVINPESYQRRGIARASFFTPVFNAIRVGVRVSPDK